MSNILGDRTKAFALRIIRLYVGLPPTDVARVLGKQLLRSGTSVGANYREGCHSRSTAEFVAKLQLCLMEMGESIYWLELLSEGGIVNPENLVDLIDEAGQIRAMLVASINTLKSRL